MLSKPDPEAKLWEHVSYIIRHLTGMKNARSAQKYMAFDEIPRLDDDQFHQSSRLKQGQKTTKESSTMRVGN